MATWDNTAPEVKTASFSVAVRDTFDRANTVEPAIGNPDIGSAWSGAGSGGILTRNYGYISSNEFTTSMQAYGGSPYLYQVSAGRPVSITVYGKFTALSGEGTPGTVLFGNGLERAPGQTIWYNSIQVTCTPTLLTLAKIVAGSYTSLGTAVVSLSAGTSYKFTLNVNSVTGQVEVLIDDVSKIEYQNAALISLMSQTAPMFFLGIHHSHAAPSHALTYQSVECVVEGQWTNGTPVSKTPSLS